MHLLKWQFQPKIRSRSWGTSIVNARLEIERLLFENPSLSHKPAADLAEAYAHARRLAAQETGIALSKFPVDCSYSIVQVLGEDWLPG
jgi:hypothetical protein